MYKNKFFFYSLPVYRLNSVVNEGLSSFTRELPQNINVLEAIKNTFSAKIFAAVAELQQKIKKGKLLKNKDVSARLEKLSDDIDDIGARFSTQIKSATEKPKLESFYNTAKTELITKNKQINQILFAANLLDQALSNNPENKITALQEDAKYLALNEIADKETRTEAYMLLSIIEKHWSKNEAEKQYDLCNKNFRFDINELRRFFTKENGSHLKVGFVYNPSIEKGNRMLFYLRNPNGTFRGFNTPLPKLLARLRELAQGRTINSTLPDLENAKKEADSMDANKTKQEIFTWLKAQNSNNWQTLPPSLSGKMASIYGKGCGDYLYRYLPQKNTVLIIRIQNGPVKENSPNFGGEIYLESPSNKTYGIWQSYDKANTIKMLNHYLVKPETNKYIAERGENNTKHGG